MSWHQKAITLSPKPRGFHLITQEILTQLPELRQYTVGIAHIFIQHTSASLAINENVEPEVRADLESHFNKLVPENAPYYTHTYEGPDDMPSHIRMVLTRTSETVPIVDGKMQLGTWQGIFLFEHRRAPHRRKVFVTVIGE